MYSATTRIMHVNEVANVPSTLVQVAQQRGKAWSLRRIPAGKDHPLRIVSTRLVDLGSWLLDRREADLVHLHYATNGYYGWGRKPFVLHLHGSDVRRDWHKPGLRQVISYSLRRADAVLCATPDLVSWVSEVRPDAHWVPNPLPLEFFTPSTVIPVPGRVVFSSRWDSTKGLDILLPLARLLVKSGVEVHGLDWGSHTAQAREAGAILHPLMPLKEFADFLASASLVVGQLQFPVLSMTDYQTLSLGQPLLCAASIESLGESPVPAASVSVPSFSFPQGAPAPLPRDPQVLAEWILQVLAAEDNPAEKPLRRQWVLDNHHPDQVVSQLEAVYRRILK